MRILTVAKSVSASYRRYPIAAADFDRFVGALRTLFANLDDSQSEEQQKSLLKDFLSNSFYAEYNVGPAEGNIDLAIRVGTGAASNIGVIFEVKSTTNKKEMISCDDINRKAIQELVLYYLRERERGNNDIRHLVITNFKELYVFDAKVFELNFYKNKRLLKEYRDFAAKRKSDNSTTDRFYPEVAARYITEASEKLEFTYVNLADYKRCLSGKDGRAKKICELYRLLSPVHLLKEPFRNDSNSLDRNFYEELLHIIGLREYKDGKKVLIGRVNDKPDKAALIENTLSVLCGESIIPGYIRGKDKEERAFNTAMELCITWVNRLLFLKLLEAQLLAYHKGNMAYSFLTYSRIDDFDKLNKLFFRVLGTPIETRDESAAQKFPNVPYLNSSLFEPTRLERDTIRISNLEQTGRMPLYKRSVLYKDERYRHTKSLPLLEYIFAFLDAYDFASEGGDEITEYSKSLINASVLGLIFEKINGYKDGSVFTPGVITSYMCRESIIRVVVDKFDEYYRAFGWNLKSYRDLLGKDLPDVAEANRIINSIRICDPAVGSGHFLVSALNELVRIKYELGILTDTEGVRLKKSEYTVCVENDELIVTDADGAPWVYNPRNSESRRIQQALFNEKRTIIENCLFGVDINPNSVNICRLRLWIELLKNAYYTPESNYTRLETLPNIDINIKCGNSMLFRYELAGHLVFPGIKEYKEMVAGYRQIKDKGLKHQLNDKIKDIKRQLTQQMQERNPVYLRYVSAQRRYNDLSSSRLFDEEGLSRSERRGSGAKIAAAKRAFEKAEAEYKKVKVDSSYDGGFEWRIEFPEVLDDKGNFYGFDLVIGNPPYLKEGRASKEVFEGIDRSPYYEGKMDIWYMFACYGIDLLRPGGYLSFIATNNWVTADGARKLRDKVIADTRIIQLCDFGSAFVFDAASIQTMIMLFKKDAHTDGYYFDYRVAERVVKSDALKLLESMRDNYLKYMSPYVRRADIQGKYIVFDEFEPLARKLERAGDVMYLSDDEIQQGIVPNPDVVNPRNITKLSREDIAVHDIAPGTPVFVIPKGYIEGLTSMEQSFIRPLFEPTKIFRYRLASNDSCIIYLTRANSRDTKDIPHLIAHLKKFRPIMDERRETQKGTVRYYQLHWPREQKYFDAGEKILVPRKTVLPRFCYTTAEAYVMMAVNVIVTRRVSMKYLAGLLNSKLMEFWLRHRGKMQGDNFQLDKEPLQQMPIVSPEEDKQHEIAAIVDEIISAKSVSPEADTSALESAIDLLVYRLYGLTYDEVCAVDPVTPIKRHEY